MLARLLRWLRGRPAPAPRPDDTAPPPPPSPPRDPYRGDHDLPSPPPAPATRTTSWWPHRLVPPGLFVKLDVYALFHGVPILYLCTNDIVFVIAGRTYILDHARCEPATPEFARYMPHSARDTSDGEPPSKNRRLTSVLTIESTALPLAFDEAVAVERHAEPTPSRDGPRVDLAPQLRPEIARILASGERLALASLLALLDLLARFDGHTRGEIELLPHPPYRGEGNIHIHLGACGPAVFGDRLDEPTRTRVLAALAAGVTDTAGELRVHAVIDKRESLNGCSGHAARLCLARLTVTPTDFVYEDEALWSEYVRGTEYS